MSKFRKKPVEVEASQFSCMPFPGVCPGCQEGGHVLYEPHIHTLEGRMLVSDGDWIITGVKGEKYPCKADIFAMTYEPVEPVVVEGSSSPKSSKTKVKADESK